MDSQRGRPYAFAGRRDEIARIHRALNQAPPQGRWRGLLVVEGAPGAGKSALLEHMCDRFAPDANTLAVYSGSVPRERAVGNLYGKLAAHLSDYETEDARRRVIEGSKGVLSVAVAKGALRQGSELDPAPAPDCANDIADLPGFTGRLESGRRAIVFVDEALRRGEAARHDYYASRIRRTKMPESVSADVHRALGRHGRLRQEQALSLVGETVDALDDGRVIDDIRSNVGDNRRCLRSLIHAGVLSHEGRGHLISPIPSFSDYLARGECGQTDAEPLG